MVAQMLLLELMQTGGPVPMVNVPLVTGSGSGGAGKSKRGGGGGQVELTFSFEDSRVLSVAKMSSSDQHPQQQHQQPSQTHTQASKEVESVATPPPLVSPSPYHFTVLYRPVLQFIEHAHALLSGSSSARQYSTATVPGTQLRDFLAMFLHTAFLPRVAVDVNRSLDGLLSDSRAFERLDGSTTMRCVYGAVTLTRALISALYRLPHTVTELLGMIEGLVQRFTERCQDHCANVTRGSFSGTALLDAKNVDLARPDAAFLAFHRRHAPGDSGGTGGAAEKASKRAAWRQSALYAPLLEGDVVVKKGQLTGDARGLEQLALFAESFEWLADQLYSLTPHHQDSRATSFRAALVSWESGGAAAASGRSMLTARVFEWCRWCLALSDRCLINLRVELHGRALGGLTALRNSNYGKSVGSVVEGPEPFVLALNADLTAFDDAIHRCLSAERLLYIYSGLFAVLAAGVEANLLKVREKRVSQSGAALLHRDLMSLQQQANNLTAEQSPDWDAIKVLIDLLPLTETELREQAANIQLSADHLAILDSVRQRQQHA